MYSGVIKLGGRESGLIKDQQEGVRLYHEAAEHGNADAQNNLGQCYLLGTGVVKDEREGARWICKAAKQGCAVAQANLGTCYLTAYK